MSYTEKMYKSLRRDTEGKQNVVTDLLDEIDRLTAERRWIKIDDYLPEVNIVDGVCNVVLTRYVEAPECGSEYQTSSTLYVQKHPEDFTHWMAITAPESESEEMKAKVGAAAVKELHDEILALRAGLTKERDGMAEENRMLSERLQRQIDGNIRLAADLARRDEATSKHLEWMAEQGDIITGLRNDLKDRDEIIARLKEDGERLLQNHIAEPYPNEYVCHLCYKSNRGDEDKIIHAPDCPIALHRALMKELEG